MSTLINIISDKMKILAFIKYTLSYVNQFLLHWPINIHVLLGFDCWSIFHDCSSFMLHLSNNNTEQLAHKLKM